MRWVCEDLGEISRDLREVWIVFDMRDNVQRPFSWAFAREGGGLWGASQKRDECSGARYGEGRVLVTMALGRRAKV